MKAAILKNCAAGALLAAGLVSVSGEEISFQHFEDGTTQGWSLNNEGWAGGFAALENSGLHATGGARSLKARFPGQFRRWGAYRWDLGGSLPIWAIQFGGTLFVDVTIPPGNEGIQEIGLSFQQPDVTGTLNWQETWFPINGATGVFTIALPVQRTGAAPVTLNLGQNAAPGRSYEIFADNVRFEPNPPPVKAFILPRLVRLNSFEGSAEGFEGFPGVSIASRPGHATDGERCLEVSMPPANTDWAVNGAWIDDPGILSEIEEGGTLLADVTILEGSAGLHQLGIALTHRDPAPGITQMNWVNVSGGPAALTLALSFSRFSLGPVQILIGRDSTAPATICLDNIRFRIDERIGGNLGTLALERKSPRAAKIHFTGALETSDRVDAPFQAISRPPPPLALEFTEPQRFFRARDWPGILFSDDFENTLGWETRSNKPGGWRGIAAEPHTGARAFGTAENRSAGYPESLITSLISPVIDLSNAGECRLFFYEILDAGGEFETDIAEIFARTESGEPLPDAAAAFYQAARRSNVLSWTRREIDLPVAAAGQKIRLEFRFTSDSFSPDFPQAGWFVDDVMVVLKP